ncbi:shikimate dehydrogenase [Piscinibacter koreensis]|uniref:Shikimate dehydrogenase (NADP(+)) n=1 Tax=Piscinibacter koreensis TaxID=2742824 RepID=A0A7Y6NM76_9BURK|nr:shikimate dehydrogenase [Schlegelella koreensis]NUZ05709.1 shikimate dehydrogenase [Schlegelella koreensis]
MSDAVDRYVVLGNPVEHSQSPFMQQAFAAQLGERIEYGRLLCALDGFADAVRAFAAGGGRGCNVTMPFKFEACTLATRHSPRARLAGACNTLRFDGADWLGDNTDGIGLVVDIERNAGVPLAGRRVLMVGAGGAAAGALGPLLGAGPAEMVVANRSVGRAVELVERHRPVVDAQPAGSRTRLAAAPLDDCGSGFDLVVNASASSLKGASLALPEGVLRAGGLAVDMAYGPAAHGFLRWAEAQGATGRDGLGMLVEQGAEAYAMWRGRRPATAAVLAALRERVDTAPAR